MISALNHFIYKKIDMNTMDNKTFQDIIYDKEEDTGIVTITLNRPERKNAITFYTVWELCKAVDAVKADETATAVILIGTHDPKSDAPEKEAFSSGGFLNSKTPRVGAPDVEMPQDALSEIDPLDFAQKRLTLKLFELDKPVVAGLNGYAIGGGFTLILVGADLIYASEHAWVQLPFVRLGVLPEFAATYVLPRVLGLHKAKEIIYFGKKITAIELFEFGIINGVIPHDQLLSHVRAQTMELISPKGPMLAVRMAKQAFHAPLIENIRLALDRENRFFEKAYATPDFKEFLKEGLKKRR
jgi:enoyl-CoA hydratase/carnithine racemase